MARTDTAQVGAVIEVDDSIPLEPFINAANELVTEFCGDAGYTDIRLAMIETWLAAHFYTVRDPRVFSVGAGPVNVGFGRGITELGLQYTSHGQQALRLDTKGGLAAWEARAKKGYGGKQMVWLGTDDEDE